MLAALRGRRGRFLGPRRHRSSERGEGAGRPRPQGRHDSLDAEFADHAQFLRALARRVVADGDAAEDLVQETFVAALVQGPREHDGLLPWLSTVVLRIGSNRRRTDARRREREHLRAGSALDVDASVTASEIEVARRLLGHVEALPEPYRTVVFLRYYEGLPPREIASRTGASGATVRTRLARALAQLRARLDADDPRGREAWLSSALAIGCVGSVQATKTAGLATLVGGAVAALVAAVVLSGARSAAPESQENGSIDAEIASPVAPLDAAEEPLSIAKETRSRAAVASPGSVFTGLVEDAMLGGDPGKGRAAAGVVVEVWVSGVESPDSPAPSDRGGAVSGRVLEKGAAPTTRRLAETDGEGVFQLQLSDGAVVERVIARASGAMRAATWRRDGAPADLAQGEPLRLTRFPTGALLGRVIDPTGGAVAGAHVTLAHWEGEVQVAVNAYSDANGRFAITDTHDDSWLRAEHEDWVLVGATRPAKGVRGGWRDAEIVMSRAGTLDLEVVDSAGRAVADVSVFLSSVDGEVGTDWSRFDIGARLREQLLADHGRAAFRVPSEVGLVFTAGASGFDRMRNGVAILHDPSSFEGSAIVVPDGGTLSLRVVLGVDVVLRGKVVDADGAPVTDAEVDLKQSDDRFGLYYERLSTTEDGTFEARVASGEESVTLHATVTAPGARPGSPTSPLVATRQLEVAGLHPQDVEIRLEPRHERAIGGRVLDADGRAVEAKLVLDCVAADEGEIAWRATGRY